MLITGLPLEKGVAAGAINGAEYGKADDAMLAIANAEEDWPAVFSVPLPIHSHGEGVGGAPFGVTMESNW